MRPLRIVFFGSPEFAVPTLRELRAAGHQVVAVVTQPDKPRGRGQKPTPGPVKSFAVDHGLPVRQPERMKDEAFLAELTSLAPDLGVVAAYGKILPSVLLSIPRLGLINVHASLLPRWRGASPIHRAVMAGDPETGISIMRVVQALDAGGVFAVTTRPIGRDETSVDVERDLAEMGAAAILPVVGALAAGTANETLQDEALVTYAPRLTREDGVVRWDATAQVIHDHIRGLFPWPHASTTLGGARVILLRSSAELDADRAPESARPGDVVRVDQEAIVVRAGAGTLIRILQLQAEGRRPVNGREFAAGARLQPGARFGA
jgi:methionyl-tRNA formyltransferase